MGVLHYKETESSGEAICGRGTMLTRALVMYANDVTCDDCREVLADEADDPDGEGEDGDGGEDEDNED